MFAGLYKMPDKPMLIAELQESHFGSRQNRCHEVAKRKCLNTEKGTDVYETECLRKSNDDVFNKPSQLLSPVPYVSYIVPDTVDRNLETLTKESNKTYFWLKE